MTQLLFLTITPKPGEAARAEAVLRDMVGETRQEPGNLQYDLFRADTGGGVTLHLIERYVDEAALQAHRASPHFAAYRQQIMPLLEQAPALQILTPLDANPP